MKTYKRELSIVLLILWLIFALFGMWFAPAKELAEMVFLPFLGFAAAAFGLDAVAKQIRG